MTLDSRSDRSRATRAMLVELVAAEPVTPRRAAPRPRLTTIGAVCAVAFTTVAVTAVVTLGGDRASDPGVLAADPAPSRATSTPTSTAAPGTYDVAPVGTPLVERFGADAELSLSDAPASATHVRVTIAPHDSVGTAVFGTDPGGNNPSATWTSVDLAADSGAWTRYDFELTVGAEILYVDLSDGLMVDLSLQYTRNTLVPLGVNTNGDTYGPAGSDAGDPDLVSVVGGYVRAEDFDAFSPDHPGQPSSPEEALRWQQERDERYPDGWTVPVYEVDGVTEVGRFRIGP